MKSFFIVVVAAVFVGFLPTYAQVPVSPVSLDLGLGGGVTVPAGTLADAVDAGWHAGAKARLGGAIPIGLVASGTYNRLPNKVGDVSNVQWMLGVGAEMSIPSIIVHPYVAGEVLVNVLTTTADNAPSRTREGLGLNAGVQLSVPMFGDFDVSLKYQMLNLIGKEDGEDSISQVAANVMLMFSVL